MSNNELSDGPKVKVSYSYKQGGREGGAGRARAPGPVRPRVLVVSALYTMFLLYQSMYKWSWCVLVKQLQREPNLT
jgi:hypothetical protein